MKVLLEEGGLAFPQAFSTQKFDVKALARETSPVMDILFPSYVCPIYLGRFRIVIGLRFLVQSYPHP